MRDLAWLELDDLPPAVVVVGENRTGKSNLIHALRLALDPSLPDTARQLSAEDFGDGLDEPFGDNEVVVSVDLAGFDGDKAAMALLGGYLISAAPNVARLTYSFRPRALAASPATEGDYESILFGGGRSDERVGREVLRYVSLRVLPALRDAESDLKTKRRHSVEISASTHLANGLTRH